MGTKKKSKKKAAPKTKKKVSRAAQKKRSRNKEMGKPFTLTEADSAILYEHGGTMSNAAIAAKFFGVSESTFQRALKANPDCYDALVQGRAKNLGVVESVAYKMAKSGKNPWMTQFWLRTKGNYREGMKVELTGKDGGPVKTQDMTSEIRRKKLSDYLKFMQASKDEDKNPFEGVDPKSLID